MGFDVLVNFHRLEIKSGMLCGIGRPLYPGPVVEIFKSSFDSVAKPRRSLELEMKIMYLGLLAGALTTSSAFPQLIKSYRTKSTEDLSIWFLIAILSGVTLWILYGVAVSDIPLILTNTVSFLPLSCTLYLKIKWDVVNRPLGPK